MTNKIVKFVLSVDTSPLEIILALESSAWGLWLILPIDTFGTNPAFAVLKIFPGEAWTGAIVLSIGLLTAISLITRNITFRRNVSILSMLIWSYIDYSFWAAATASTAPITYFVFVVLVAWIMAALTWKLYTRG